MNEPETLSHTLPGAEVSAEERNEMFGLLTRHFDGVTRSQFDSDLAKKNWVIFLKCGRRLVGFSTLLAYESSCDNEPVGVIYSGDTIVEPEAWGSNALARAWIACVRDLRGSYPRGKYYWLLLTSGFRTYRFLPVFWKEFYPRYDHPMPRVEQTLLENLARERFGSQFDPATGIVRFHQPQRLRNGLATVPAGRMTDRHIAFFLARNPGHQRGDELVCLTELTDENLTTAGRRMVGPHSHELACSHC